MDKYTEQEWTEALRVVSSTIINCENMQPKFAEGTSQHTLLKNRIKALYISKALLTDEDIADKYTNEELIEALRPILSIISKCDKALRKFAEGSTQHNRFRNIIKTMELSKSMITDEIGKRDSL